VTQLLRIAILLMFSLLAAPSRAGDAPPMALVGATVYPSPTAAPIADAVVLMSGGVITAVGKRSELPIPFDLRVIDCSGQTVVAGFWNSHIHFTAPQWQGAASACAAVLTKQMQEMLTRWGFTTVWDLGSDHINSLALRARVEAGEVAGPKIFLAYNFYPKGGHPVYLPAELALPEAATPDEAAQMSKYGLGLGLDGIKLFTGAYMGDKPVVNMDVGVAKAAVDVAHAQGKPVFAHPQNKVGVDVVLAARVDILAHTVPGERNYTSEQLIAAKAQGTALIPTLALFTTTPLSPTIVAVRVDAAVTELKTFSDNGGVILFGTDVGFTKIYDTTLELELMHRALSFNQVLASLTSNPAQYFKAAGKGRVEVGLDADLAVLDGDPASDIRNLAKVAYTIRAGRIIYQKP
jgi:imidazolonepropionase-like amidohydrolase